MDVLALRESPVGTLVPITGTDPRTMKPYEHFAFVPAPLPVDVVLETATWTAVTAAAGALGRLRQVCAQLPNPKLLITPALVKEAQATSELEGTYGALYEVLVAQLPGFGPTSPEIREIRAYQEMAELAFTWISDRKITVGMLRELQQILATGAKHRPRDPGRIRSHQVAIGRDDLPIEDSCFVPPPPGDLLQSGLDAWEAWIDSDHDLPVVVSAALAHYQFETLHPFSDGNGRLGRLIIVLQLIRAQALDSPALTISPWLLRHRSAYQTLLLTVSQTGDWNAWVRFFCTAIAEQCDAHVEVAAKLLEWMDGVRRQLNEHRWTGLIHGVAESLIEWPVVTNASIRHRFAVTAPAAQSAINRLASIGAVDELTGGSYGRVYGASAVMRLAESL